MIISVPFWGKKTEYCASMKDIGTVFQLFLAFTQYRFNMDLGDDIVLLLFIEVTVTMTFHKKNGRGLKFLFQQ